VLGRSVSAQSEPAAASGRGLLSRRAALKAGATAAGVMAAGAALSACGPTTGAASTTKAAAALINILWRPWYNFNNSSSSTGHALLMQGIQPWLAQNKGVNVTITYMGYQQGTVAAMLAGAGPDIFADWVLPLYLGQNLLLDLTKYIQRDNVDLGIFPSKDMEVFQQSGGLWALPSYLHLQAPAVNLGILDQLALSYPNPGWTYADWTKLLTTVTKKSSDPKLNRVGGWFNWGGYDYHGGAPAPYYIKGFGGEYVDPNDNTQSYLANSGTQEGLSWVFGLLADGVCGTGPANFQTGNQVVTWMDTAGGLIGAAQNFGGIKWQMYDEMVFPKGNVSYAASDFYAISAATKNPDTVWEFMKYLTVETDWQKWMVHLAMNGPNQKALYPFWVETVKQVARPLANIDLDVFNRQMQGNQPYFGLTFRYQDQRAGATIAAALQPAAKSPQTVPADCNQAAKQIAAIEAAGATLTQTENTFTKLFPTANGTSIAAVTPGL